MWDVNKRNNESGNTDTAYKTAPQLMFIVQCNYDAG